MRGKRVVVTGMGAVSPFGEGVAAMYEGVRDNRCALTTLPEYKLEGLSCRVAGLVRHCRKSVFHGNCGVPCRPCLFFPASLPGRL